MLCVHFHWPYTMLHFHIKLGTWGPILIKVFSSFEFTNWISSLISNFKFLSTEDTIGKKIKCTTAVAKTPWNYKTLRAYP